ncbi:MAG: flavodoxin family protein [Rhizobiales bacterium]|nr:flavodoxin family protein [Hyphomicrobiales bacterium]MBI3674962.1 flavodoxin family protein [Hyphomicrobiales bacterium]
MTQIVPRTGMPDVQIGKKEFAKRFRDRFFDPAFAKNKKAIAEIIESAWDGYDVYRKNPKKVRAGKGFADPDLMVPVEWLETRRRIMAAEARQKNPKSPNRILLINGSMRSDQSCPGEMSKSWRLLTLAREEIAKVKGFEVEVLDLSLLTSQYGRLIHPCKACVSTAQPLCHWPCSCYPNFAMGQVNDWMADIYPMWAAAHGVMIVTPVNWYQAPAGLKAMIDRLVCADGGNPDFTSTGGKDPQAAKDLEMKGWDYPRHLAGRVFALAVHGDAAGVENLRRILTDWLCDIGFIQAGHKSVMGTYIGYLGTYAENHLDLDKDEGTQDDVKTAAKSLVQAVRLMRAGKLAQPDAGLHEARPK